MCKFIHFIFLSVFCFGNTTFALESKTNMSGEFYFSDQEILPGNSLVNSGNRILLNPNRISQMDLRLNCKYITEDAKWIARPRWLGDYEEVVFTDTQEKQTKAVGKLDLTDAYVEWSINSGVMASLGLMIDGWGPAEFVNPTNPFFHLNFQSKNFFFKDKGKMLAKLSYSPTGRSFLVFESEMMSNRDSQNGFQWKYGHGFGSSWLLRAESQAEDANSIFGIIAGSDSFYSNLLGEYVELKSSSTGLSIYLESRQTQNPTRFKPVAKAGYISLDESEETSWLNYSVLGVRYEGSVDARLEWISYDLGYNESEYSQVMMAISQTSPYLVENLKKFQTPGLEFLTKNWASISIRWPDIGPKSKWQWTNRFLSSYGDAISALKFRSTIFQTDLEMPISFSGNSAWSESWIFYAEGRWILGGDNTTELSLSSVSNLALGARLAW